MEIKSDSCDMSADMGIRLGQGSLPVGLLNFLPFFFNMQLYYLGHGICEEDLSFSPANSLVIMAPYCSIDWDGHGKFYGK